jgi:hypothetical protein
MAVFRPQWVRAAVGFVALTAVLTSVPIGRVDARETRRCVFRPALTDLDSATTEPIAADSAGGERPSPVAPAVAVDAPVFVFQDSFWINLHHFVRAESRRQARHLPLELPLAELTSEERTAWETALTAYADLAERNLVFDESLVRLDNWLAAMRPDRLTSPTATTDRDIATTLVGAADAYRAHRWSEVRSVNDQWIAARGAAIQQHALEIRRAIANAFEVKAPTDPILVDVVSDIGPNLAYTTRGPQGFSGHTRVSPVVNADPEVALDTLLHEISHTMDAQIVPVIAAEARRQGVEIPSDLWHAMTIYTTYELVRRTVGRERSDASYAPNAAFVTMFDSASWRAMLIDLDTAWRPHLDGTASFKQALAGVVQHAPHGGRIAAGDLLLWHPT